jgi:anti-anti-sigma factor
MNLIIDAPRAEPIRVVDQGPLQLALLADDGDVVRLQCAGDIHWDAFDAGSDPLTDLVGPDCYGRKILVNLEKTRTLDSSGVGWLVACQKRCAARRGHWVLHSLPPWVKLMLHLMHLESVLEVAEDEAAASRLVRNAAP